MASTEEIERRVEEFDSARSATRSATAKQIGELAQRRAAIAEQLINIERELGDVLANSADAIDIDELARFTDVPAADLTRWLTSRKITRAKRRRPVDGAPTARTPTRDETSPAKPVAPRTSASTHVAADTS